MAGDIADILALLDSPAGSGGLTSRTASPSASHQRRVYVRRYERLGDGENVRGAAFAHGSICVTDSRSSVVATTSRR